MAILLGRTVVVPMWLIVVGVVALVSPAPDGRAPVAVFVGILIVATALVVTLALGGFSHDRVQPRGGPTAPIDSDARDLERLDSDKG